MPHRRSSTKLPHVRRKSIVEVVVVYLDCPGTPKPSLCSVRVRGDVVTVIVAKDVAATVITVSVSDSLNSRGVLKIIILHENKLLTSETCGSGPWSIAVTASIIKVLVISHKRLSIWAKSHQIVIYHAISPSPTNDELQLADVVKITMIYSEAGQSSGNTNATILALTVRIGCVANKSESAKPGIGCYANNNSIPAAIPNNIILNDCIIDRRASHRIGRSCSY